jgi:hypothetical protein
MQRRFSSVLCLLGCLLWPGLASAQESVASGEVNSSRPRDRGVPEAEAKPDTTAPPQAVESRPRRASPKAAAPAQPPKAKPPTAAKARREVPVVRAKREPRVMERPARVVSRPSAVPANVRAYRAPTTTATAPQRTARGKTKTKACLYILPVPVPICQ